MSVVKRVKDIKCKKGNGRFTRPDLSYTPKPRKPGAIFGTLDDIIL